MLDPKQVAKYPDGYNTYPSGMSGRVAEVEKAATELNMENPQQYARDVANGDWYEECRKAFDVLSRDVNGNQGAALARLFADEHPELQHMWYMALNVGMMVRHPELYKLWTGEVQKGRRDHIDGRVRYTVADFVANKDIDWED